MNDQMKMEDLDNRAGPVEQQTRTGPIAQRNPSPPSAPSSDATQIEQQRAVAQVQGALVVAQQRPRDEIDARNRLVSACENIDLAEHAFWRFERGRDKITGPSIHLATEMARCWGNIDYGLFELRRDDIKRESEMLAYAWDLETNTRITHSFIVPHRRDTRDGAVDLTSMRDIYENNANAGARRVRECIFRAMPKAFVELGQRTCSETLQNGAGEPIEQRREKVLEAFSTIGVSRAQIENRMKVTADRLSGYDIGQLRVIFQSIKRGEIKPEDEFKADTAGSMAKELDDAKSKTGTAKKEPEPKQEKKQDTAPKADTNPQGSKAGVGSTPPTEAPAETDDKSDARQPTDSSENTSGGPEGPEIDGMTGLPALSTPPTPEQIALCVQMLPDVLKAFGDESLLLEYQDQFDPVMFAIQRVDKGAAEQMDSCLKARMEELSK